MQARTKYTDYWGTVAFDEGMLPGASLATLAGVPADWYVVGYRVSAHERVVSTRRALEIGSLVVLAADIGDAKDLLTYAARFAGGAMPVKAFHVQNSTPAMLIAAMKDLEIVVTRRGLETSRFSVEGDPDWEE